MDRIIFELGVRQHGAVARAQLLALGVGEGAIEGRIKKGMLTVVHRGVYFVAGRPPSRDGWWLAAVLACEGAVLSHWDAAELWAIVPARSSREVHVSVPPGDGRKKRRGIRVHRVALHPQETTRKREIAVTTPARTLFDLAALMPRRRLERALDEAAYLHLLPAGVLDATLRRNRRRSGGPQFRAALATHVPGTTRTRSALEELFLALCRSEGFPQPLVNSRVAGLEVDFCWPDHMLVVETDGYAAHRRATTLERDHERDALLRAAGYAVLRFTYRQVTERPGWVATSVRHGLASA